MHIKSLNIIPGFCWKLKLIPYSNIRERVQKAKKVSYKNRESGTSPGSKYTHRRTQSFSGFVPLIAFTVNSRTLVPWKSRKRLNYSTFTCRAFLRGLSSKSYLPLQIWNANSSIESGSRGGGGSVRERGVRYSILKVYLPLALLFAFQYWIVLRFETLP